MFRKVYGFTEASELVERCEALSISVLTSRLFLKTDANLGTRNRSPDRSVISLTNNSATQIFLVVNYLATWVKLSQIDLN